MMKNLTLFYCLPLFLFSSHSLAAGWSNSISSEVRYFIDEPANAVQQEQNIALGFRSEYDHEYESGHKFAFELFARGDENDDERDHIDIAELYWTIPSDNWELLIGINKVFWGVTESAHLVDVINQTDQLEGFDGEDKLGQAMLVLNTYHDWGNVDFYVLPYFRERAYTGEKSRLRIPSLIDSDAAIYESSDKENHIDFALRWSHTIDVWDIGFSYFDGTSRTPDFRLQGSQLVPFYPLMQQAGIDIQVTTESWLWKLEAIDRQAKQSDDFQQAAFGFEYTFYGINDSDIDLGLVIEYLYDDRGEDGGNPFEDDILVASRLAFNDVQSTELLAGIIQDLDTNSYSLSIEASRRLGQRFKLELESRFFDGIEDSDAIGFLNRDSYLQADLTYYF